MSKTEITEEKVQALADLLEDVFYAGRYSDNEVVGKDQADWRRVAICALQEANELKASGLPNVGDRVFTRDSNFGSLTAEEIVSSHSFVCGSPCFFTQDGKYGPFYLNEEGDWWKRKS